MDGDPQVPVVELSTASVVLDGDTELVRDAVRVGDTEGIIRDSGGSAEIWLGEALVEVEAEPEIREVRMSDDSNDDCWDALVTVGRAPDVKLVKDGAVVSGVPRLGTVKDVTELYAVPTEVLMLALGGGVREEAAVPSDVVNLALGESVSETLASLNDVLTLTLCAGVDEVPAVSIGVVILELGETVREATVSLADVVMLAFGGRVEEILASPDEVVMLKLGESVREAAVSPTEVVKLAIGGRVGEILASPDEVVILALGESVREAPVASSVVVTLVFGGRVGGILASPDEVIVLLGEGVGDTPVANEVLTFALRDGEMEKDGVADMPVPNEVLMLALWDVVVPGAGELLDNDVMGVCFVVSGKGQAQVKSLDGVAVGDKSDVVPFPARPFS